MDPFESSQAFAFADVSLSPLIALLRFRTRSILCSELALDGRAIATVAH